MPAAGRAGQFSISATLIFCYSTTQGAAGGALGDVFGLGGCDGLPLHVGGVVGATSAQRLDVVGDPAGAGAARFAGGRAGVEAFEGNDGGGAARCGLRFGMLRQCDRSVPCISRRRRCPSSQAARSNPARHQQTPKAGFA